MQAILRFSRSLRLRVCLLGVLVACIGAPRASAAQELSDANADSEATSDRASAASASSETSNDADQDDDSPTLSIGEKSPELAVDKGVPGSAQKTAGYIVGGVGIAGLAVGTIFGLRVLSKNDESESLCPTGQLCSPADQARYHASVDDARSARTVSLLGFGLGGAAIVAGAALLITAPKRNPTTVSFVPNLDVGRVGASLQGAW